MECCFVCASFICYQTAGDFSVTLTVENGTCTNSITRVAYVNVNQAATPVITVTAPNGANNWYVGNAYNITWSTAYAGNLVKIDYSVDNGSNWLPVTTSTNNNGSYNWTIPNNIFI